MGSKIASLCSMFGCRLLLTGHFDVVGVNRKIFPIWECSFHSFISFITLACWYFTLATITGRCINYINQPTTLKTVSSTISWILFFPNHRPCLIFLLDIRSWRHALTSFANQGTYCHLLIFFSGSSLTFWLSHMSFT